MFLLSVVAPAAHSQVGSFALRPIEQQILATHNRERAAVGAPALRWNAELARDAAQHAQYMARTGRLVHAPREGRGAARENLSGGPRGWTPDQLMRSWLAEKRYFHGGIYPDVCAGGWSTCAHYTQVIWPATTDLGCGMAVGSGSSWLVCRYSPGGNKDGRPLGLRANAAPGPGKARAGSSASRQQLSKPSQFSKQSSVARLCASSGGDLKKLTGRLEQLKARKAQLVAEIRRVESAMQAAEAGLAQYDPSLIEELLGTSEAPSNEQIIALNRRLEELKSQLRSNEAEVKVLLDQIKKAMGGSGPCDGDGERERENSEDRQR
jgi:hypothetical protein